MRRLVLLGFIWGWSYLFIKVAVDGMTPTAVSGARIALGMIVMLAVLRARRTPLPRDRRSWRHFAVMAVVHSAVPFTLLAWGEQYITSALAAVLTASTPLFAALVTAVALGERLRPLQLLGLAVGFAGVAVAAGVGGRDLATSSVGGAAAAVATSACYGLGFAYARRHLGGISPLVASAGQLVVGTAVTAPLAVVTTLRQGLDPEPHRVLAVVLLGVVGTGFAYVLNYRSIAEVGPTRASLVTYVVPIVAVAVGVVFLGEPFELRLVVGGVIAVLGITMLRPRVPVVTGAGAAPGDAGLRQ